MDENRGMHPTQPLHGVKVVEFCHVAAGPFCGMLLADFGAEVVKVEAPEGDAMRQWPPLSQGFSENFASINRGKRSVVLDLKDPPQRERARRLVLDADVLIENSRPGAMQRLGLGWDWFGARKPSLVYCSISAFGQDGPRGGGDAHRTKSDQRGRAIGGGKASRPGFPQRAVKIQPIERFRRRRGQIGMRH